MNADRQGADDLLTREELARSAAVDETFVEELATLGIVEPDEHGYHRTDVYRVRFGALLVGSGIDLHDVARAIEAGVVSFGDLETLFPHPAVATAMTHRELAAELGVDIDVLIAVRLATGLADRRADDAVRSDDEAILRDIVMLADGLGGVDQAPAIGRMYGDRAERVATAALSLHRQQVDRPWLETGERLDPETSRQGSAAGRDLLDRTEMLLLALYRRAIDDGLLAGWLEMTQTLMTRHGYLERRPHQVPGIAFVDLSGFTSLTAEKGDEFGTTVAMRLLAEAQGVAAASGIRIVKLLGDGVMLHGDDPERLVEATLELVDAIAAAGLPPGHAGVHAGPVIERDGDYFGHTVNVASRIASEAAPGEVIVSAAAAQQLPDSIGMTEVPVLKLRGVPDQLTFFRVERR